MSSYTTPDVGLSCRSMSILLYAVSQTLLTILWIGDAILRQRDLFGQLATDSVSMPPLTTASIIWYIPFALGVTMALFSSILGSSLFPLNGVSASILIFVTAFQLLGLYQNCLCYLPVGMSRNSDLTSS